MPESFGAGSYCSHYGVETPSYLMGSRLRNEGRTGQALMTSEAGLIDTLLKTLPDDIS